MVKYRYSIKMVIQLKLYKIIITKTLTSEILAEKKEKEQSNSNEILAPMPCTLTKLNVKVGDKVTIG